MHCVSLTSLLCGNPRADTPTLIRACFTFGRGYLQFPVLIVAPGQMFPVDCWPRGLIPRKSSITPQLTEGANIPILSPLLMWPLRSCRFGSLRWMGEVVVFVTGGALIFCAAIVGLKKIRRWCRWRYWRRNLLSLHCCFRRGCSTLESGMSRCYIYAFASA